MLAGSKWQNPFRLKDCPSRAECLARYKSHLMADSQLMGSISELAGRRLMCHCRLTESCHADVLIQTFASMNEVAEDSVTLLLGIHFSPQEFAVRALALEHPFEPLSLDPRLLEGIRFRMTSSVAQVKATRRRNLDHLKALADLLGWMRLSSRSCQADLWSPGP